MAHEGSASPGGEIRENCPQEALFQVFRFEDSAAPILHDVMLFMARVADSLKKIRKTSGAAHILGRRAAFSGNEAAV